MAKIIVYSADWCPYCDDVKSYLDSRGIDYETRDIDKDPSALDEMLKLNGGEIYIPVIRANDQVLRGFNPKELDRAINDMMLK